MHIALPFTSLQVCSCMFATRSMKRNSSDAFLPDMHTLFTVVNRTLHTKNSARLFSTNRKLGYLQVEIEDEVERSEKLL